MKNHTIRLLAALATLGFNQTSFAQHVFNTATANWSDSVWYVNPNSGQAAPSSSDDAIVYYDRTANVVTAGQVVNNLILGDASGLDGGTVNVNTGGGLTIYGNTSYLGAGTGTTGTPSGSNGRVGILNVNGGTLTTRGNSNFAHAGNAYGGTATLTAGTWNNQGTLALSTASSTGKGTLNINGGTFTTSSTGYIELITGNNTSRGTLNINGGTFNNTDSNGSDDPNGDVLRLQSANINITTGTVNLLNIQCQLLDTTINVHGDAATINLDKLNPLGNNEFNFFMDSDGVSTIASSSWLHLNNGTILVDGTNYTGGEGSFTLFSSITLASLPVSATAENLNGFNAAFSQSGNDYIMTLTAVPEPSSCALLGGLIALGWLAVRRRKS